MLPVPQFAGRTFSAKPLDGNICLRVDQSSQRVLWLVGYLGPSLASRKLDDPRGGNQWFAGAGNFLTFGDMSLCRGTGAVDRRSLGV